MATPNKTPNRLNLEKSPYLLQHADNPVDWHPWGEQAFEKARKESKPVLLSIGYSTCHWCHVMAHESFEDEATAQILNEHFVSIKVDREERPDLDHVYMDYVMETIGRGGWPMTVFLTPDKIPFYGGTYFPPENRYGMPGFKNLLHSIADAWKTRKEEILKSAQSALIFLREKNEAAVTEVSLTEDVLKNAFDAFGERFDAEHGGFGHAPKFPMGHSLSYLLGYWKESNDGEALRMAEASLKAMAQGGLYDQLAGGFHRYSTDALWRIPHFEKMLYDQALLTKAYLEAYQISKDPFYERIARETLDYVASAMTGAESGFYSAEDADSLDTESGHSREGAYYVWSEDEIRKILGDEHAPLFFFYYGIKKEGNAIEDPQGEFNQKNVLYAAHSSEEAAAQLNIPENELGAILAGCKKKLRACRDKRPAPYLDDKILTDWNGLMLTAFAMAASILNEPRYLKTAQRTAQFILKNLKNKDGRLLHRYRDGEAGLDAHLDDYAFLIQGLLSLYQADFDETWLEEAIRLAEEMISFFWDEAKGGLYFTSVHSEELFGRTKISYDGAIPSGNSVAALDLLMLSRLTGDTRYEKVAERILKVFAGAAANQPTGASQLFQALLFSIGPSYELVISPNEKNEKLLEFIKEINGHFIPNKVVLLNKYGKEGERIRKCSPFLEKQGPVGGNSSVFVCRQFTCELPVTDAPALREILSSKA